MCKPAWWPTDVSFNYINNSKNHPKRNDLISLMESYRDWNLQDQHEENEMIVNSHYHNTEIPIPPAAAKLPSFSSGTAFRI